MSQTLWILCFVFFLIGEQRHRNTSELDREFAVHQLPGSRQG